MNDNNTLHFKITVDGNGLKEIQNESTAAFSGIRKAVNELSKESVDSLQDISLEVMQVVERFNALAKSVGISPKELRQTLNFLREMRDEQQKLEAAAMSRIERISNAEAKLIRQQIGNLEEERRAKEKVEKADFAAEQKLASIKASNISYVGKLRDGEYSKFISQINAENKKIKEQGDTAVAAFEKALGAKKSAFGSSFSSGASNVFSGKNNGTFSNILGGFGGGGGIGGTIASALDGGLAGGEGGAALLGGLAAGAGIGVAIAAITAFISLMKSAISLLYDWGKAGIQSAADFEQTVNSVAVFAGGVTNARRELSLLEETASNTPGLSLEGAEQGYKQLRALGFEAENSRKLIEGLGKIKITSGATEQSVERVIVNLTQLSSSTARAGQDIREIVHALPAMRQVFREAFGTSEASKLKSLIDSDGDAFFTKLAAAMENFKGASGGMNSAVVELNNQWTLLLREFGKPVVPVLTEGFHQLTTFIKANKDEFKAWGLIVADAIRGAIKIIPTLISGLKAAAPFLGIIGQGFALASGIFNASGYRNQARKNNDYDERQAAIEEANAKAEEAATKAEIAAEKMRERQLKSLEDNFKLQKAVVENFYKVEEERVAATATYTIGQEIAKIQVLGEVRKQSLLAQRNSTVGMLNEQIALNKGNNAEIIELEIKKSETISKFNADYAVAEIKLAKDIADAERRQLEQRRSAELEFSSIRLESVKSGFEQVKAEVSRGFSLQILGTETGYSTLKDATTKYYEDVRQITFERYQLQYQDLTLSEEQRRNLIAKANLEMRNLATEQKNALLKISDDQLAAEDARREKNLSRIKSYYASLGELITSGVGAFFNTQTFTSGKSGGFEDMFLEGAKRSKLTEKVNEFKKQIEVRQKEIQEISSGSTPGDVEFYKNSITFSTAALKNATEDLEVFEKSINPVYREIDKLSKSLETSIGNFKDFDEISKLALKERQRLETESMEAEIKNVQRRLDNEKTRVIEEIQTDVESYKSIIEKLEKSSDVVDKARIPTYQRLLSIVEERLANANSADFIPSTDKAIELEGILKQLGIDFSNLKLKQHSEEADEYANSIDGLAERFRKLNSGDIGAINGILNGVAKDVIRERIALLEENVELEARFGIIGDDAAARYRNAWLKAIYDVKSASIEAKESQIRSQVEIANQTVFNADVAKAGILDAMAGAKGYTEIFQDAFLSVNSSITDGISTLLHKATEGLGAFGDILANIASQLLSMVANRLMMRLLDLLLPSTGGVGIGSAPSTGGGIGSIFGSILGTLGLGGGLGNRSGGNSAGNLGGLLGDGINVPLQYLTNGRDNPFESVSSITAAQTLTGSLFGGGGAGSLAGTPRGVLGNIQGDARGFQNYLSGGGAGLFSNFSFANLGKTLGAAAPLLGLSLGAGLGGSSISGQLLGGIGGLAGGLALGIGTGAIGTGATAGFSILGGVLSAGAATGILAAAAVPLLLGAFFLGRDKQRKADEKTRTGYINDAMSQLEDILTKVRSHDISGSEALSSAEQIRSAYQQQASSLKDRKTRNIALKEINDRINPKIEQIRAAAAIADEDKKRFEDRIPGFATGGIVPGRFGEPRLVLAHGGEIIANPSQQTPAFLAAASDAGVPGIRGNAGSASGNNLASGNLKIEFVIGTEAQNQLFVNGAKSNKGYNVTIEQSKKAAKFRDS